jgi:hypothetical protein
MTEKLGYNMLLAVIALYKVDKAGYIQLQLCTLEY